MFKQIVEGNKLNGAKEGVEQCLIRDVIVDDLTRLMWLIDEGNDLLDICILPLLYSLNSQGVKITIEKVLENPTENDWKALLKLDEQLEDLQLHQLRKEFLTEVMEINPLNYFVSISLSLNAISVIDFEMANYFLIKINDKEKIINAESSLLFKLGNCHDKLGNYDLAIECYEKCLTLNSKNGDENNMEYVLLLKLGNQWLNKYNLDLIEKINFNYEKIEIALDYYEKSQNIFLKKENNSIDEHLAKLYNNVGKAWLLKNETNFARDYFNKSLDIRLKKIGCFHPLVSNNYFSFGLSYDIDLDNEKSIEYYLKSLEIRLISLGENHIDVAIIYNNLGCVFYNKRDYKNSLYYFNKSLIVKLTSLGKNHSEVSYTYHNIAISLKNLQQYEDAIRNFSKGKYYQYLTEIAICYEFLNKKDKALEYFIKSAKLFKKKYGNDYVDARANERAFFLAKELNKESELPEWMKF